MSSALAKRFPAAAAALPVVGIGHFPTPVTSLPQAAIELGVANLLVKRDDLSEELFGGNKSRKMEFALGEAMVDGAKTVMTFGAAGSNHAAAAAVYCNQLGLRFISVATDQTPTRECASNLRLGLHVGAEIHIVSNRRLRALTTRGLQARQMLRDGRLPYVVPLGGSSPRGAVGFVNAAFELLDQIDAGDIARPDRIYVAHGTGGTVLGLALGLAVAGSDITVSGVRVTPALVGGEDRARQLYHRTNELLHEVDSTFPILPFSDHVEIRHEFYPPGFSMASDAVEAAVERARGWGISIETTYTGKAFAALVSDADDRAKGQTVMFWNTAARDLYSGEALALDRRVPRAMKPYLNAWSRPTR